MCGFSQRRIKRHWLAALAVFASTQATAATITVTPGAVDALQTAVFSAAAGDTLILKPGVFQLSGGLVVQKQLTIRGESSDATATTIQGAAGAPFVIFLQPAGAGGLTPTGSVIENLTVSGGMGGIVVTDVVAPARTFRNIQIRNVRVLPTAGASAPQPAVAFNNVADSIIDSSPELRSYSNTITLGQGSGNIVMNNTIYAVATAVLLDKSNDNVIARNRIASIPGGARIQQGIGLGNSARNRVEANRIEFYTTGAVTADNLNIAGVDTIRANDNFVGYNVAITDGKDAGRPAGSGIWYNCGANNGIVYGNFVEGNSETGFPIFQASNTLVLANASRKNAQGGMVVWNVPAFCTVPQFRLPPTNTYIRNNYFNANYANGGVIAIDTSGLEISDNYVSGRPSLAEPVVQPLPGTGLAGFILGDSTTTNGLTDSTSVYGNIITSVEIQHAVRPDVRNLKLFRNRHIVSGYAPSAVYSIIEAGVTGKAHGHSALGGNYWSAAASGGGGFGAPYRSILTNTVGLSGVYVDYYPWQSESMGETPSVQVTEPLAGSVFAAGSVKTIRWDAKACVHVDINLVQGSTVALGIQANYPNTGYYIWTVPAVARASNYAVRVDCKNGAGQAVGASSAGSAFSIASNTVQLVTQGRYARVNAGDTVRVAWARAAAGPVNVFLGIDGSETLVASNVAGNFTDVTLPANVTSARARIRIASGADGDQTDGYFALRRAAASGGQAIVSPTGGQNLVIARSHEIEWSSVRESFLVDIDFFDGERWQRVATSYPDIGRYTWLVPEFWTRSAALRITYKDTNGNALGTTAQSGFFNVLYTAATGSVVNRYRLYLPATLEHLFTTDFNEYSVLGTRGWIQEGVGMKILNGPNNPGGGAAAVPFYRIYIAPILQHLWTTDRNEYLTLRETESVFQAEGVDGYVYLIQAPGTVPLYRMLLKGTSVHHWTTDANEFNVLTNVQRNWIAEGNTATGLPATSGVVGYVFP